MLTTTGSFALVGTEARLVEVEVDVGGNGIPRLVIVGLPAASVREAEQRTRSAIESSGHRWPPYRMVANLAPGALRKEGTQLDLALALGILAGDGAVPKDRLEGWIVMGELALDGTLRPVRGVLAAALMCRDMDRKGVICPAPNAPEAILAETNVVPVSTLGECIEYLKGVWTPPEVQPAAPNDLLDVEDLAEVKGQRQAKEALEVAAAGGHNLILVGPPGSGKTMLARRLPTILPPMSREESLEVTRIHSVAGLLVDRARLVVHRPFRNPHHHVSLGGLIGGGSGLARPGEISLAQVGTLL